MVSRGRVATGFRSFGAAIWIVSGNLGVETAGRVATSGVLGLLPGLLLVYGTVAQLVNHTTVFASEQQPRKHRVQICSDGGRGFNDTHF
ncbi:MAG: hypothetical protein AAF938_21540 [Myxococcota bacterium]